MSPRRLIIAGVLVVVLGIFGSTYLTEHQSCYRTNATRAGLRMFFDAQALRVLARARLQTDGVQQLDLKAYTADLQAAKLEHALDCSAVVPGTA